MVAEGLERMSGAEESSSNRPQYLLGSGDRPVFLEKNVENAGTTHLSKLRIEYKLGLVRREKSNLLLKRSCEVATCFTRNATKSG